MTAIEKPIQYESAWTGKTHRLAELPGLWSADEFARRLNGKCLDIRKARNRAESRRMKLAERMREAQRIDARLKPTKDPDRTRDLSISGTP